METFWLWDYEVLILLKGDCRIIELWWQSLKFVLAFNKHPKLLITSVKAQVCSTLIVPKIVFSHDFLLLIES